MLDRIRAAVGVLALSRSLLLGLSAAISCVALAIWNPAPLSDANLAMFDQYQRAAPRTPVPDTPVRVITIDDASLARLGQWPWPRTELAALVANLRDLGAAAIAFDMVFAEPDRTSPARVVARERRRHPELAETLEKALATVEDHDHDVAFADEIARSPVVLGAFLTPADVGLGDPPAPAFPASVSFVGDDPSAALPIFERVEAGLPELAAAAPGVGAVSLAGSRGGLIRQVPMFSRSPSGIAPALSIEALRVALQQPGFLIRSSAASGQADGGAAPVPIDLRVGPFTAPLTEDGRFWVRFAERPSAPVLPIWRFIAPERDLEALRPEIEGRIVLIGASAPGLRDLVATPLAEDVMGVAIHAEIIEQILTETFLVRPDWTFPLEVVLTLLSGVGVAVAIARLDALPGAGVTLLAVGTVGALSWIAFREHGLLLGPVAPIMAAFVAAALGGTLRYAQSETQRRLVREQFEHFVSADVVEEIAAEPERYLAPGGETRELTLLFADIHGFSHASEGMAPDDLIALLNDALTPMADAVIEAGGTVDKFMGDAMMAFWNAPRPIDDHPTKALGAALRLQRDLARVRASAMARGGGGFEVGVGLNTGFCSVGAMGSRRRLDYSCIGDAVNLASRLEGLTRQYHVPICVGQATAERVSRSDFALLELDQIRVHGRDAPERVFALLGDADTAAHPQFIRLAERYGEARAAFHDRAWSAAASAFRAAATAAPPGFDPGPLCAMFADRAAAFAIEPPDADWDGVWRARTK